MIMMSFKRNSHDFNNDGARTLLHSRLLIPGICNSVQLKFCGSFNGTVKISFGSCERLETVGVEAPSEIKR